MTVAELWTELEAELEWRQAELRFLANTLEGLNRNSDRDRFRRVIVVMLYAHVEGFCKVAFSTYVNLLNRRRLACRDVAECIAAAAFSNVFHALAFGDRKGKVFPSAVPADDKLLVFARQREFFVELDRLLREPISIPDSIVNTESNLGSVTLRRNLFRLGFSVNLLEHHDRALDELMNRRNNIAHGIDPAIVRESDYQRLKKATFEAKDEMALAIVDAVEQEQYRRLPASPPGFGF
jgi:hypothetical protein